MRKLIKTSRPGAKSGSTEQTTKSPHLFTDNKTHLVTPNLLICGMTTEICAGGFMEDEKLRKEVHM